ncbi:polymeric immunoglobulin receptor-like protein [Labeo rohita]|nr:polymeric immunoglobulin receptor-like protein [Labeo rohita]
MKILLIFFTFYLISGAVKDIDVTGYSGGSVLVDSGKRWFSDSDKYMAKLPEWRTIINDIKHDKWINEGRFTLFRNNKENLMIYIRELNKYDSGKYLIWVNSQWSIDMTLNVEEELNLTKYEGNDVSIQCKHQDEDQKSFCKAHEVSMCVKDGVSLETIRDDRFSFSDEASTGVFTVNITDLREEDSGIYWCGAHVITKVSLTIKREEPQHQTRERGRKIQCHYVQTADVILSQILEQPKCTAMVIYPQSPLMGSCTLLSLSRSMKSLSVTLQSDSVRMRFNLITLQSVIARDSTN